MSKAFKLPRVVFTAPFSLDNAYLCDELLIHIFSFLQDAKLLCALACVNKQWRRITEDNSLWKVLLQKDFQINARQISNRKWKRYYSSVFLQQMKPLIATRPSTPAKLRRNVRQSTPKKNNTYLWTKKNK